METDKNLYYNWQLLRRQPEYREFYDRYAEALENKDEDLLHSLSFEQAKRWSITVAFDYRDDSFPAGFHVHSSSFNLLEPMSADDLNASKPIIDNLLDLSFAEDPNEKRYLPVVIDLKRYKTAHGLGKLIENLAEEYKKRHGSAVPTRTGASESLLDRSLVSYDLYELLVQELKDDEKCFREIARRLVKNYQSSTSKDPKNFTTPVRQDINRIKEYVKLAPYVDFRFET